MTLTRDKALLHTSTLRFFCAYFNLYCHLSSSIGGVSLAVSLFCSPHRPIFLHLLADTTAPSVVPRFAIYAWGRPALRRCLPASAGSVLWLRCALWAAAVARLIASACSTTAAVQVLYHCTQVMHLLVDYQSAFEDACNAAEARCRTQWAARGSRTLFLIPPNSAHSGRTSLAAEGIRPAGRPGRSFS